MVALTRSSGGCSASGEDFSLAVRFSHLARGWCYEDPLPRKSSPRDFAFQKAGLKWWLEFGNFKGYGKGFLFGVGGLELPPGLSHEEPVRCCVQGWMPCVGSAARPRFPGAMGRSPGEGSLGLPRYSGGGLRVEKILILVLFLRLEAALFPSGPRP